MPHVLYYKTCEISDTLWKSQINVTFPRLRKYTRHTKFLTLSGKVKQTSHFLGSGNIHDI